MSLSILPNLFTRELRALRREVEAYPDDSSPWQVIPGPPNTAGTLVLHLAGNLQHFIGAALGRTGYLRDREGEFARRELTRDRLLAEIDATVQVVDTTLARLSPEQLEAHYPVPVNGRIQRTGDFLLHLLSHLSYHLGQIDYHRRTVTKQPNSVGAVAITELPEVSSPRAIGDTPG